MAKAYWINTFRSIRDPEKVAEYIRLAGPVMRESGGRFLARGTPARVFESGVMERTVVIEFGSVEQAVTAYESPGYQEASMRSAMAPNVICGSSKRPPDERAHRSPTGSCGMW